MYSHFINTFVITVKTLSQKLFVIDVQLYTDIPRTCSIFFSFLWVRTQVLELVFLQVCTQVLELPEGVSIVTATVAAGHLSSSSIYPACFAPYLISTACSDGRIRFWKCCTECGKGETTTKYDWKEWEMMIKTEESSAIKIPGKLSLINKK